MVKGRELTRGPAPSDSYLQAVSRETQKQRERERQSREGPLHAVFLPWDPGSGEVIPTLAELLSLLAAQSSCCEEGGQGQSHMTPLLGLLACGIVLFKRSQFIFYSKST